MDNFVADLVQQSPGFQTFWAVFLAAMVFVLVNTVSHAIQETINERRRHRVQVKSELAPVLAATSDLVSRLCEILVYQRRSMISALEAKEHPDILVAPATKLDRLQSTAYRLLRFLALSHHFQASTANIPLFSHLRHAYYFLQRKLPTSFKGGFYHASLLSKEEQEFIAAEICDDDSLVDVEKLNISRFAKLLKSQRIDIQVFDSLVKALEVDPAPIKDRQNINHNDQNWRKLLAWAHTTVYLIDFFQDLSDSPRWEEHRIVLIGMIRQWNIGETNPIYLYHRGDLQTNRYLDTYSERLCWGSFVYWFERLVPGDQDLDSPRNGYRRWVKKRVLNRRGKRYEATHRRKRISSRGIHLQGSDKLHEIIYTGRLASIHEGVLHYLHAESEILQD